MVSRNRSRCLRSRLAHSMPAETWAARASARCSSSSVNGFLPVAAVEVQHAQALARRAQQHAQDRGHGPVGDADGPLQFGVVVDAAAQDRFAAAEAALGQVLAEVEAAAATSPLPEARARSAQAAVGPVGQDDGAALGVEHGDGVVEDRVEQFFFAFEVTR